MTDTIFGKIARGEIPTDLVYEDVLAFRDLSPEAPVHLLVIPCKPIPTLNDAQPEDAQLLGRLLLAAAKVARVAGIAESGYRAVLNCNVGGSGKVVFHLHQGAERAGEPLSQRSLGTPMTHAGAGHRIAPVSRGVAPGPRSRVRQRRTQNLTAANQTGGLGGFRLPHQDQWQ